jgi:N-acyl-D-aspartate/D-glutamate deacylase
VALMDLVIRGGTVVDGTGAPPRTADVAVAGGVVTEVGRVEGTADRVVDADGALVTPGFVDVHAHYDGQATWDAQLLPSAWHGVTTVVSGNCGVGFAPVRPADRDQLIELMEGVEDIPGTALHEGLAWNWESFDQYLDALDARPHDIDIGAQVPHGALRLYVMGERGARREPATPEDIAAMAALAREAIEAGALGFTTSRTRNHRTSRGDFTPTLTAEADELAGIAAGVGAAGAGVIELISDIDDPEAELAALWRMAEVSGRPLSISVFQRDDRPDQWRMLLDRITEANARGLPVRGQVASRPIGLVLGLQATLHPFMGLAAFAPLAARPLAEQVAALTDPAVRQPLLAEAAAGAGSMLMAWDRTYPLDDPPDYEPPPESSIAGRAAAAGVEPAALALDLLVAGGGQGLLYRPLFNYTAGDLEAVRTMLTHPHVIPGLADGGAHVGTICDASFPTTLLTHWGRDRRRGERLDLAALVQAQTARTAAALGLRDRGMLTPGLKADVNVIDFDNLTLRAPHFAFDLPAGGRRLMQRADGYLHTFVSGQEVYADGEHTGALPGRLVRGGVGVGAG